jgi:hypothetical protein
MTVNRRFAVVSGLARFFERQCGSEPVEGSQFGGPAAVRFTSRQNSAPSFSWQRISTFPRTSARWFRELTQKRRSKYAQPGQV